MGRLDLTGPVSPRLERRRLIERAWNRYVRDGTEPPSVVGPEISHSWHRARETLRIDPGASRPTQSLSPEALEERRMWNEVLRLAPGVLQTFADGLSLSDHALAYFDSEGWMLSILGDPVMVDRLEEISFRPGTSWSEESAGTNGPGTSLATGKPVEVFASEHYVAAWQPWSCAAAPIRVPGSSTPVGIVDLTGPWEVRRRQALMVVKAIARAIEERIHAVIGVRDEVIRHALRSAHESGDALVAIDSLGRVIAMNDAASRRRLVVSGGALPPDLRGTLIRTLRSPAPVSREDIRLELPGGLPAVATTVQYEGAAVGALLRVQATGSTRLRPREPDRTNARPSTRYDFGSILGKSPPFLQAVDLARTAARNDLSVVLTGDSGTGKELFAQAIHGAGSRQSGPFVVVNCGSIPSQLVEAELFGYEGGTFTGAKREGNSGRCEDAEGGTLFLDEVSELPLPAQIALLRVLQEKEVVRLGGSSPRPVDIRVVAATNRPLQEEIRAGRFRSDLYYRLNVLPISLPPLRDRSEDVSLLAELFLREAEVSTGRQGLSLAAEAIEALRAHSWPGNVRELRNVILRAAATATGSKIFARDLTLETGLLEPAAAVPAPAGAQVREAVARLERDALLAALETCGWNLSRAARKLGTSRMTLYRWMTKYGIAREPPAR
jgi:sigma-54 dependent transcriptional regulator, acetoin dehydrogenase operon transcriptional activator AcoR